MKTKLINNLTTILGIMAIVAAIYTAAFAVIDSWWNALGGGVLGMTLIWFKGESARDLIEDLLGKAKEIKDIKKEEK